MRSYDSLTADHSGTFGYGWRLAVQDVSIQTTVPPTGHESSGIFNPFRIGTRVYLTLPTGQRVGFTFAPARHDVPGLTYYTPAWTADPGGDYTLASAAAELTRGGDRLYDLQTARPYNPASGEFDGPHPFFGADGKLL